MGHQWVGECQIMKIQCHHTIFSMSLLSAIGMLTVLIFTLGIEPEGREARIVWNGKDIAPRVAIYSKCEGKVRERIPVVKVVKKDKGTVITVRSYISELSRDGFYQAKFNSDSYDPWQNVASCWPRNGRDKSEVSESGEGWGTV